MLNAPHEIVTNLVNLLPTGTFLTFQTLAAIFTNGGKCTFINKLMTSLLILAFSVVCFTIRFTDSVTTQTGIVYYGIASTKGLYNPQFLSANLPYTQGPFYTGPPGTTQFFLKIYDFINGFLTVICFCTLALLTSPVTECFYPHIPQLVTKTVPVLVALLVSLYFAFAPPARRGIGFAITNIKTHVLMIHEAPASSLHSAAAADQNARFSKSDSGAFLLKNDGNVMKRLSTSDV